MKSFEEQRKESPPLNPRALEALLNRAEETNSEAIIIYKDNKLIVEKYFAKGRPDKLIETMSCTKSIVGLAIACLLADKELESLDIPVHHFYPEWNQGRKKFITVRHLATMTSGLQNVPDTRVEIYPSPDFIQLALAAELSHPPGEVWEYNNKAVNLLSGIIQKATGKRLDMYIAERIFKPIGITKFEWEVDKAGNPMIMAGCKLMPPDFVKIGLLVLNEGRYNNKEIIPKQFITEMLTPCKQYAGYGILWWIDFAGRTVYRADGYLGNYLILIPDQQIMAARMMSEDSFQSEQDNFLEFKEMVLHLVR